MTASTEPAVVVLAALTERPDPALPEALREAIAERTADWAAATGRALVSSRLDHRGGGRDGTEPFAEPGRERLPAALARLLVGHDGPVLLVGADVPRLDPALAEAALGDLAAGCALSFAPSTDGKPFLLALRSAAPELLAFAGGERRHRDELFAAATALDGDLGLLRSERRVVTPADARALAIDPLIPAELRKLAAAA